MAGYRSRLPGRIENSCLRRRTSTATVSSCRSEEHTSELQSQSNLVCRLLLENTAVLALENVKRAVDAVAETGRGRDFAFVDETFAHDRRLRLVLREHVDAADGCRCLLSDRYL